MTGRCVNAYVYIGFILGILILIGSAGAATNVSACTTISAPGVYELQNDIIDSASTCINIAASDVIFDGQGYTIDGTDTGGTYGVYVYNSSTALTNVTVKNLVVTDWFYGIYYAGVQNGSIENNNASSNFNAGIYLYFNSNYNTLINNTASNSGTGIYLYFNSNYNTLINNTASNNQDGIGLSSSSNSNTLINNTVNSNTNRGIILSSSNSTTLINNTVSLNAGVGIDLTSSSGNTIYNNFFNNTGNAGIGGDIYSNAWNTTKQAGANIIGGPNLGGNFWAKPDGTGYSETCNDGNDDGICDSPNTLAAGNVDYLPLTSIRGIHRCGVIVSPGVYRLAANIIDSSATEGCIEINSSDVVLDGKGYTLKRLEPSTTQYGVYVSGQTNVTVKNLTVTGWSSSGIGYVNSDNGTIANNNASNNLVNGIFLDFSSSNTLTDNTANSNNQNGIYLYNSSNYNNLINNTASNNLYGISLDFLSNYNTLVNNTVNSNNNGIYLSSLSSSNTVANNTASSNTQNGISLSSSGSNNLTGNTMKNNQWDFYSTSSPSNTIIGSLFTDTRVSFTYSGNIQVNSSSSPASDPSGYSNIGKYLNIVNTSDAWVYLNISYTDAEAAGVVESSLRMWEYGTSWAQVSGTNGVNEAENYVYAYLTSFSVFAPMGVPFITGCTTISTPGVYLLNTNLLNQGSTCINITASDVIFDGQGYTIDGTDTWGTYGVYVYNSSATLTNVTVKNLNVTDWSSGIYYQNAQNGSIENNNASSNTNGIYLYSSSSNTLTDNNAWNNTQIGIWLGDSSNGNTLTNNNASYNNDGIYIEPSSNTLTDNNANNNGRYGIWLTTSNSNTLTGNNASSNSQYGIYLQSSNSNSLTDNTANSNTMRGIYLFSSSSNNLTNNTASSNSNTGIYLSSASSNNLTNNTASSNNYGIYLWSSNNTIITNNTASGNVYEGIRLASSSSNNTLKSNTASGNTRYGIWLDSSSNNTITNNNASSNSQNGIYLSSSNNNTLTNNTANSNNYGIYLRSSNNTIITNNNASSNYYGIRLYSSSNNNTLTGNTMRSNQWDFVSLSSSSNTIITNLFTDTRASFTYSGNIQVNSSSSPASDPAGYSNIGKYLNITNTSAAAWVYLNVSYTDAEAAGVVESTLRMWEYNGTDWSTVSGSGVNTTRNYVYANLSSFSVFAPMADTPPSITIVSPSNTTYSSTSIALNVSADEVISAWLYSLNGGSNTSFTPNTTITAAEGANTLVVYANDTIGNWNSTTVYFTVDTTPPGMTFVAPTPANGSVVTVDYIYINITSSEDLNTALLDWNGTNYTMSGSGRNWYLNRTGLANGAYTYRVWANDSAGNMNASESRIVTVNVPPAPPDTTPPVISGLKVSRHPLVNSTTSNTTVISWSASDAGGIHQQWVAVRHRNGTLYNLSYISSPFTLWVSQYGTYNVTLYANDTAGNLASSSVPLYVEYYVSAKNTSLTASQTLAVVNDSEIKVTATAGINGGSLSLDARLLDTNGTFGIASIASDTSTAASITEGLRYVEITNTTPIENITRFRIELPYTASEKSGRALYLMYWNGSRWYRLADYAGKSIPDASGGLYVYSAGDTGSAVYAEVNHTSIFGMGGSAAASTAASVISYAGREYTPEAVLLANSIDLTLAQELIAHLKARGINVHTVGAANFSEYSKKQYLIILGGPEAYEGIGGIVAGILTREEKTEILGGSAYIKKPSVFRSGGVMYIFAGKDRNATREAWMKGYEEIAKEIEYNWG
ncbi:NosD domain-containing protein [Candidatus Pyrohabitans sp.]